ncbi:MAG TPA: hypothetical protein VFH51_14680, partial [Myxococcota bacterium]|nr:hypothetical protein [Myxococcota bacterium]
ASGLDALALVGPERGAYADFGLYAQIFAPTPGLVPPAPHVPQPQPVRGPIRRETLPSADLSVAPPATYALAIHDDLLNQLLWAVWYSGAFTIPDLRQIFAADGDDRTLLDAARVSTYFTMPPVLGPSDLPNQVEIGVGDAYAEADINLYELFGVVSPPDTPHLHAGFYFSSRMLARLTLDSDEHHLQVQAVEPPMLHVQVVDIDNPAFQSIATGWLERMLLAAMPRLMERALGTFPLPVLQVGRLPGVPNGEVWHLHESRLEREAGGAEFVLKGKLRAHRGGARAPASHRP